MYDGEQLDRACQKESYYRGLLGVVFDNQEKFEPLLTEKEMWWAKTLYKYSKPWSQKQIKVAMDILKGVQSQLSVLGHVTKDRIKSKHSKILRKW